MRARSLYASILYANFGAHVSLIRIILRMSLLPQPHDARIDAGYVLSRDMRRRAGVLPHARAGGHEISVNPLKSLPFDFKFR